MVQTRALEGIEIFFHFVVVIDDVCQEEQNELLRAFSHHPVEDPQVRSWISFWMKEQKMRRIRRPTREEVDQIMRDLVKRLPTEERLEGLAPKTLIDRIPSDKLVGAPRASTKEASPENVGPPTTRRSRKAA